MRNRPAKTTSQKRRYGSKFSRQPRFIANFSQYSSRAVSTSTHSSGNGRRIESVAPRCLTTKVKNPDMPNTYKKRWNHEQHYISGRPPTPEAADRTAATANDLLITPATTEDRYRYTRNKPRDRRKKFTPICRWRPAARQRYRTTLLIRCIGDLNSAKILLYRQSQKFQ